MPVEEPSAAFNFWRSPAALIRDDDFVDEQEEYRGTWSIIGSRRALAHALKRHTGAVMSLESVALGAVVSILALGTLYAVSGDRVSEKWRTWTAKASIAAAVAFGIGTLLLGIPGAFFLEAVTSSGLKLHPDSAWPLSILITQVGALLILPASLVLRFAIPSTVGWGHVGATAILTFVATLLFTILVVPTYAQL